MIKVIVNGAYGRMGREVLKAVSSADDMEVVGAIDTQGLGTEIKALIETSSLDLAIESDLAKKIVETKPDVVIDFTVPQSVYDNIGICLEHKVRPVVGTTGLKLGVIQEIIARSALLGVGGIIAPNFALGAILMMEFAAEAAKHFPNVEIIELHHDQKLDAPSGTAITTAERIIAQRGDFVQGPFNEMENIIAVRGGKMAGGVRIHSVRLPGLMANQEVIFGGLGQTLTIRHDTISRESFMPGVLLAVRKVMPLKEIAYGLDKLLFEK